jgi:hypothetical protein
MTLVSDASFGEFGGPHVVEYAVEEQASGVTSPLGRATWADWDHGGRLIVAREGRLEHWRGPGDIVAIADFSDQVPDPQPAPEWAVRWPSGA